MRDSRRSGEGRAFFPSLRASSSIHGFRGKFQILNVKVFLWFHNIFFFLCLTF